MMETKRTAVAVARLDKASVNMNFRYETDQVVHDVTKERRWDDPKRAVCIRAWYKKSQK
jgi:hypothetical protein